MSRWGCSIDVCTKMAQWSWILRVETISEHSVFKVDENLKFITSFVIISAATS